MALNEDSARARYKEMEDTEEELWPIIVTGAFKSVARVYTAKPGTSMSFDDVKIGIEVLKIYYSDKSARKAARRCMV